MWVVICAFNFKLNDECTCGGVKYGGGVEGKSLENGGEGIGGWETYMGGFVEGCKGWRPGELLDGGRGEFRAPSMAEGQEVFRFDDGFQGRLKHCRDIKGMERLLRKTWNGLGMGHRNQLECSDKEFSGEVAWNFGCQHEVNFSGPGDLGLS